jgi:YbgC/YbaW family acyl-CoA thioester hydrolase
MTAFPAIELMVYPYDCDAFGHLNQAALLTLLERARWDALARGPGMDLFDRNGVWPAVRKATIEYKAPVFARDVVRVETTVLNRGITSMTLHHVVRRVADETVAAEADIVFVCIDRLGRATPLPDEIARFLGPRSGGSDAPLRVPSGGVELAVEVRGDGVPVVFVHGFPFDRTVWRHQLATLSRARRIAADLRGVGGSGGPPLPVPLPDRYSLAQYANDLVAVLDAVGVRDVVWCGLSMGGYIIFEVVRRHPERVKALILAGTKADADSSEAKRGRDELAALAEREGPDAVVERLLPRLLAPATRAAQPEVTTQVRDMGRRWSVPAIVGAQRVMRDRPDSTETLRGVRVPTLVLVGSDDEIAPPAVARAMAQLIPGAQFHVVPAAGHLAPLEQPLATSRLVADFLSLLR